MNMDFVRAGGAPSAAGADVDVSVKAEAAISGDADVRALLAAVTTIRRLLDEK